MPRLATGLPTARWLVGLLAVVVALLATIAAVRAQDVPFVDEQITDQTGLLDERTETEAALRALESEHGIQLWVLFVFTTGDLSATEFVDAVAEESSFGGNDALLMVAIDDRSYASWLGPLLEDVSDEELDEILVNELEPRLGDGDFDGAVAAFADGLGAAFAAEPTAVPATPTRTVDNGGSGQTETSGGGISIWPILGVIGVVVAGFLGFRWFRKRTGRGGGTPKAKPVDLDTRANVLLLEVDELLQDTRDELGFAEAQFRDADVKPLRDAVDQAGEELKAAFLLRQKLDDNDPEPPAERKSVLERLIQHCERAKGLLEAQTKRIEEVRNLERNAPEILAGLGTQVNEVERGIPAVERRFDGLRAYAPAVWEPLDGNIVEAQKRLEYTREAVTEGLAAVTAGQAQDAAFAAREGQTALADAKALLDAIEQQAALADEARGKVAQELAAAEADIAAARAAMHTGRVTDGADALARAETQLAAARREAAAAQPDPFAAIRLAGEANAGADAVLARIREEEERQRRQSEACAATIRRAETAYRRAADYIFARRGGVGSEARTRLAEAERRLEIARGLCSADLSEATNEAARVEQLAGDALRLARADFEGSRRWDDDDDDRDRRPNWDDDDRNRRSSRRPNPAPSPGRVGAEVLGGVLGGILGSGMSRGGFGGTKWGGPGRSGGGGFKLPSGGFGGGRSRGGRW